MIKYARSEGIVEIVMVPKRDQLDVTQLLFCSTYLLNEYGGSAISKSACKIFPFNHCLSCQRHRWCPTTPQFPFHLSYECLSTLLSFDLYIEWIWVPARTSPAGIASIPKRAHRTYILYSDILSILVTRGEPDTLHKKLIWIVQLNTIFLYDWPEGDIHSHTHTEEGISHRQFICSQLKKPSKQQQRTEKQQNKHIDEKKKCT